MPDRLPFDIVRLTPDDWRVYREVRQAALADAPWAFGGTLEREQAFVESDYRTRLQGRASFAARVGERYVGLVGGLFQETDGAALLISMWVAPSARGQGVGDALVKAVLKWAREIGCEQVRLWVTEGNEPAERLYARNGFVPTGEKQAIRPGEWDRLEIAMVCDSSSRLQ
jgi:GNAT superfamily N-acetyltransferase